MDLFLKIIFNLTVTYEWKTNLNLNVIYEKKYPEFIPHDTFQIYNYIEMRKMHRIYFTR